MIPNDRRMTSRILVTIFVVCQSLVLAGCVYVPPQIISRARRDLGNECYAMFAYGRFNGSDEGMLFYGTKGYQYWGDNIVNRAFAIGYRPDGSQVCSYFSVGAQYTSYTMDDVKDKAVSHCNTAHSIRSCVLYAVGGAIIYDKAAHRRWLAQQQDTNAVDSDGRTTQYNGLSEKNKVDVSEEEVHTGTVTRRKKTEQSQTSTEDKLRSNPAQADKEGQICLGFGFPAGTSHYSACRLQVENAKRQSINNQLAYEAEYSRYINELGAYESRLVEDVRSEAERKNALLGLLLGPGVSLLMNSKSPIGALPHPGPPPIPPEKPGAYSFTITNTTGVTIKCTALGGHITCY